MDLIQISFAQCLTCLLLFCFPLALSTQVADAADAQANTPWICRCKQQLQQAAPETQALVADQLLVLVALHYPHLHPQARPVLLELLAELVSLQAQVCSRPSAPRPWLPVYCLVCCLASYPLLLSVLGGAGPDPCLPVDCSATRSSCKDLVVLAKLGSLQVLSRACPSAV